MAASLDDILTTQKNGVVAINGLNGLLKTISDNLIIISGNSTDSFPSTISATIAASTTTLIVAGAGKLFSISITAHAGSAQIFIYNSATTGGIAATNCIYASHPANVTPFILYEAVQLPYTNGLVVKTEAGMNCCIGYTPNP
jgi:hypothetical protein